ncbi:right-handed parallel beta-helix repeat-containing protein [Pseudomonas mosselii]|uniref:right-handed parallel beta-helix repeat-containing protein n=1 Tax=Pseudomonas mosselii TaxID=78327 RepID=UPI0027DC6391|nr:right-handed parallel beta-helix repeat-containing protein [Pseudomonas mosselii]
MLKRFTLPVVIVGSFSVFVIAFSIHKIRQFEKLTIDKLEQIMAEAKHDIEKDLDARFYQAVACREITSLPADIREPGIYCLRKNLDNRNEKRDSITLFTDNVTIKGNGFCVNGSTAPSALHSGIRAIDRSHVAIENICIRGHKTGVLVGDTKDHYAAKRNEYGVTAFRESAFIKITDSTFSQQTFQGIHVRGANITVARNTVEHTGGVAGENPFATGIHISAINCDVSYNRVFDLRPSGNGEGVGIAFYHGAACQATHNYIDPFRTTTHGRTFGIWSKGGIQDIGVLSKNVVVNADYAYGPFGIYKDNKAVNAACRPFVDRVFSLKPDQVGGVLVTENTEIINTANKRACGDRLESALAKFKAAPNKYAAYSVVLSYGEQDPDKYQANQIAWILLAADMGHETATAIVKSSPTAGSTEAVYEKGRALYKKMKVDLAVR